MSPRLAAKQEHVCVKWELVSGKEKLQQEWELLLAPFVLSSDLQSCLDKRENNREVVEVIEDTLQVLPLIQKE